MRDPFDRAVIDDLSARIGERAAIEAARAFGQRAALQHLRRRQAEAHARRLLDQGEPRVAICDRLMVAFRISRRSAYRAIEAALCQRGPSDGTRCAQSAGVETTEGP